MKDCVSVIVPIYKVEAYLKRAVASICRQTYENLEIILVEDGSPDRCGELCEELAKEDNRIKVIHKENGGLSDARNAGLDVATGKYIAFVDSDDYIAVDFVEKLVTALEENAADVAMCSYAVTTSLELDDEIFNSKGTANGIESRTKSETESETKSGIEICDTRELLLNMYDAKHQDATYFIVSWNKIYKASLWKDIRFPKGKIHEDEATTYKIYDKAGKGVYLHEPLYGYFSAPESITRAKFNLKRLDWMDALTDRIAFFEEKGEEELAACARKARADAAIHYYYPLKEELPECREERRQLKHYVLEEAGSLNIGRLGYLIFLISAPLYRIITAIDRGKKERLYQFLFVVLSLWLAFLCFYKLDVKYVDPWDEARHGVNAYEMQREGRLVESTYLYETDYYNLKPPMSMWMLMLSMKLFGSNVFALRFPSALCYLILALVTAGFLRKRYGTACALVCLAFFSANTTPFLAHMIRAGDADSLYVLIFTLAMLAMLKIREKQENLYWCGFLFALAFLTKSYHAGVIAVIGGLYLLITGELKRMKLVTWVKFALSAGIPLVVWALLRFRVDGLQFFKEMILTDVLGRSGKGFGSNEAGFSYYFSYYLGGMSGRVQVYLVVLLGLLAAGIYLLVKNKRISGNFIPKNEAGERTKRDITGFALWILVPTLMFSAVSTKLLWYLYPVLTALLVAAAVLLGSIIQSEKTSGTVRECVTFVTFMGAMYFSVIILGTIWNYGINGNQINEFQMLIRDTAAVQKYDGMDAYMVLDSDNPEEPYNTKWSGQDVFVAEAYGDYMCKQGGSDALFENFAANKKMLLFTTAAFYESNLMPIMDSKGLMPELLASRDIYVAVLIE